MRERDIMNWGECKRGFIRNVSVDDERISSIVKKAMQRLERANETKIKLENVSFVVDNTSPTLTINRPVNSTNHSSASVWLNASSVDTTGNVSVFNDYGLVGWWTMDDVNSTGDPWDRSVYCYDNETKIMTDDGWKLFSELGGGDRVKVLDPETGEIGWEVPIEGQEFDYEGKMYKIKTKKGYLTVSPEHNVYFKIKEGEEDSLLSKILNFGGGLFKLLIYVI